MHAGDFSASICKITTGSVDGMRALALSIVNKSATADLPAAVAFAAAEQLPAHSAFGLLLFFAAAGA